MLCGGLFIVFCLVASRSKNTEQTSLELATVDRIFDDISGELVAYQKSKLLLRKGELVNEAQMMACRESVSVPAMLQKTKESLKYLDYEPIAIEVYSAYNAILHYQLCQSEAAGMPLCGNLASFRRPIVELVKDSGYSLDRSCVHRYYANEMMKSMIRGDAKAVGLCKEYLRAEWEDEPGVINLKVEDRFCRLLNENWEIDASSLCARMFSLGIFVENGKIWKKNCTIAIRSITGEPGFCRELEEFPDKFDVEEDGRTCRDRLALKRANQSKKIESCGASSACRRFMGMPGGCGLEEKKISDWYCGRFLVITGMIKRMDDLFIKARVALAEADGRDAPAWHRRNIKFQGLLAIRDQMLIRSGPKLRLNRKNI